MKTYFLEWEETCPECNGAGKLYDCPHCEGLGVYSGRVSLIDALADIGLTRDLSRVIEHIEEIAYDTSSANWHI